MHTMKPEALTTFPYNLYYDTIKSYYEKTSFKIKLHRTNWHKFEQNLNGTYKRFLTTQYDFLAPEEKYNFFLETIINLVKSSTPNKTVNSKKHSKRNPVEWWDEECSEIIKSRKASYKKWQTSTNLYDLIEY